MAHSAFNTFWTYGTMAAVAAGIATMLLTAAPATWLITRRAGVFDGPAPAATHTTS